MLNYDHIDQKYDNCIDNWVDKMAKEFEQVVRSQLQVWPMHLEEIATSIALSIYDYQGCENLCNDLSITSDHALCYLNVKCGSAYDKKVEQAYDNFIQEYE